MWIFLNWQKQPKSAAFPALGIHPEPQCQLLEWLSYGLLPAPPTWGPRPAFTAAPHCSTSVPSFHSNCPPSCPLIREKIFLPPSPAVPTCWSFWLRWVVGSSEGEGCILVIEQFIPHSGPPTWWVKRTAVVGCPLEVPRHPCLSIRRAH